MPKQYVNNQTQTMFQPGFAGTDPKDVREEIQQDVQNGIGAMTAKEAGSHREDNKT
jgi:hypothetical protein